MSVITAEPAPPDLWPPVEEYGVDPSIAYSLACSDVIRAEQCLPNHLTLALAQLLVSAEVKIAQVRKRRMQILGITVGSYLRSIDEIEQSPGMFIEKHDINPSDADMAITVAISAILAIREKPDAHFDVQECLRKSLELEEIARFN